MLLSDAEIAEFLEQERPWFNQWRAPSVFSEKLKHVKRPSFSHHYFTKSKAKWVLEAWVLNKFAAIVSADEIKLSDNSAPDAYAKIDGNEVGIEITSVSEPGRKIAEEYRDPKNRKEIELDPVENWVRRAESAAPALAEGISIKIQKRYSFAVDLLVYLNISEYGIRQQAIEEKISEILSSNIGSFAAVWVLWKNKVFCSSGKVFCSSDVELFDD